MFALTFLFATAEDVFVFFAGVFVLGLDLDLAFAFGLGDADLALGDADRPLGEVDLLLLRVETAMARQRFIFLLSLFSSSFFLSFQISHQNGNFQDGNFLTTHVGGRIEVHLLHLLPTAVSSSSSDATDALGISPFIN